MKGLRISSKVSKSRNIYIDHTRQDWRPPRCWGVVGYHLGFPVFSSFQASKLVWFINKHPRKEDVCTCPLPLPSSPQPLIWKYLRGKVVIACTLNTLQRLSHLLVAFRAGGHFRRWGLEKEVGTLGAKSS